MIHIDVQNYFMNTKNKVATTVKVNNDLYDGFKILGIRYKLTLQKLVERAIYRYVNEEDFRTEMNNFTGSLFYTTSSIITAPISTSMY